MWAPGGKSLKVIAMLLLIFGQNPDSTSDLHTCSQCIQILPVFSTLIQPIISKPPPHNENRNALIVQRAKLTSDCDFCSLHCCQGYTDGITQLICIRMFFFMLLAMSISRSEIFRKKAAAETENEKLLHAHCQQQ